MINSSSRIARSIFHDPARPSSFSLSLFPSPFLRQDTGGRMRLRIGCFCAYFIALSNFSQPNRAFRYRRFMMANLCNMRGAKDFQKMRENPTSKLQK